MAVDHVEVFVAWLSESFEWKSLWPALFGAVGGAVVGVMHSQRASRKTCMIEQIASYRQDVFAKEPSALGSLIKGIPAGTGARAKEDEVRFVGNWFDAYSALALSGALDRRLRKRFGVDARVLNFWKTFEKSPHNATNASSPGMKISHSEWPNMAEFAAGHTSWWRR